MNLHKDPSSWVRVSPQHALNGSKAQGENVLKMAVDDIGRMDTEIQRLRKALQDIADTAINLDLSNKGAVKHMLTIAQSALKE